MEDIKELKTETAITFKLSIEEFEIIKKASEIIGLGHTTFSRSSSLERAKKIIKELS